MSAFVDGLLRDLRDAARVVGRSPGLVAVAALSLGLGIGLNAVLYMAIHTIYWHQPTMRDPARVVAVEPGNANQFSFPDYHDLLRSRIFDSVAGFRTGAMNLGSGSGITRTGVMVVTANFFEALGIEAGLGRAFTAGEAAHEHEPRVAVVTSGFWRARLAGGPGGIGGTVVLDGVPFQVVGVLPDSYRAVSGWMDPGLYVPASRLTLTSLESRPTPSLTAVARLKPGTTAAQARQAVTAFAASLERTYPDRLPAEGRVASVFPVSALQFRGTPAQFSFLVTVAWVTAGLVLLIACINVTGLLMARAAERRRELAIRVALGASRRRIVRTMLAESFLLVMAGAAAGLPFAYALGRVPFPGSMGPLQDAMSLDARLLPFAAALVALATLACGVLPALRASRPDVFAEIGHGGDAVTPRTRLRQGLVAAQVAMSFVLVVGALLCVRSQALVARTDPGFDLDSGVVARIGLDGRQYPPEARVRLAGRLVERIEELPGVESASVADVIPLGGNVLVRSFHPAGRTDIPGTRPGTYSVAPGYFRTLGIPLVRGRDFEAADRSGAPAVAIVNETFARTYFQGTAAVGRRVQTADDPEAEVIGVVLDHRIGTIGEAPASVVYYAYAQKPSDMNVHVRTATSPEGLVTAVHRAIGEIAGPVPIGVQTLRAATSLELTMRRTGTWLMGVMGGVGLLLAAIGIYGVMAQVAAAQKVEIGVRMALGASSGRIRRDMLARAAMTVAPGVALGVLASLAMLPAFRTFLAGASPFDFAAFAAGAAVLLVTGLISGYIPARRMARLDPVRALRRS